MYTPELEGFIPHAERFGSECVYETAEDFLDPEQLGYLALRLRRIDGRWRLSFVKLRPYVSLLTTARFTSSTS